MIIAAVGDLDVFKDHIREFWKYLENLKEPDLFLLAGDITVYSRTEDYEIFLDLIKRKKWKCPIIGVFGNREFEEDFDKIKKTCGRRIKFLNDEKMNIKIKGKNIGIVGTRGSLDVPTWWQSHNIPGIRDVYSERIEKVRDLLKELKGDIRILLMHYAPTYKTLKGENPRAYGGLGSERFEKVILETRPDLVIHGHAHYGIPLAFVNSIPVFNVALPVNEKIVEIDPDELPKSGIKKFVK